MLSADELSKITLNSALVHQLGERPFFADTLNHLSAKLKEEQENFNYFVRYRIAEGSDGRTHRWSRIVKVVELSERAAEDSSNHAVSSPTTKDSIVWKRKRFFVALEVVGEERLVLLNRISKDPPSEEEVLEFCAREALHRPQNVYRNPSSVAFAVPNPFPTEEPPMAEGEDLEDSEEFASMAWEYLPTPEQVKKLIQFRQKVLENPPPWSKSEIEIINRRLAPYASSAAATAPLQHTKVDFKNRVLVAQLNTVKSASGGASLTTAGSPSQESAFVSTPHSQFSAKQEERGHSTQKEEEMPNQNASPIDMSPSSPFLPHKRPLPRHAFSPSQDGPSSPFPSDDLGALGSSVSSQWKEQAGRGPRRPSKILETSGMVIAAQHSTKSRVPEEALLNLVTPQDWEQWEKAARNEKSFHAYISDPQREAFERRFCNLTQKNLLENKKRTLQGLENEQRLKRAGNLVESSGLWVTDDSQRASKAASYLKRATGGGAEPGKPTGQASIMSNQPASSNAGEGSSSTPAQENPVLHRFKELREKQEAGLASVPDTVFEELWSGLPPAPASTSSSTSESAKKRSLVNLVESPFRLVVPRAGVFADLEEERKQALIRAQLIHKSVLVRSEERNAAPARSRSESPVPDQTQSDSISRKRSRT